MLFGLNWININILFVEVCANIKHPNVVELNSNNYFFSNILFNGLILILIVLRAEKLNCKHNNGLSNPYCIVSHRLKDLQKRLLTEIQLETLNPVWNETHKFVVRQYVL